MEIMIFSGSEDSANSDLALASESTSHCLSPSGGEVVAARHTAAAGGLALLGAGGAGLATEQRSHDTQVAEGGTHI